MVPASLDSLRAEARAAAQYAHAPFSGEPSAVALLLSDGIWVPGVRVESASFSLTIPPALNAFTTAVAAGRRDVVAAAFSRDVQPIERAFLEQTVGPLRLAAPGVVVVERQTPPALTERLNPFLDGPAPDAPAEGVALARRTARRAFVPHSQFPVGAVLAGGGVLVPGVNVEPPAGDASADWSHVLCAERSALGTACSYGLLGEATSGEESDAINWAEGALYLSCPKDPGGSPCGACRQLLVELLPHGGLWMDRGEDDPEYTQPVDLLPGSFRGATLARRAL